MSKIILENNLEVITPNWIAAKNVKGFTTTKVSGYSTKENYKGLNLSYSNGDDKFNVTLNRKKLEAHIGYKVNYLKQNHTSNIINLDSESTSKFADASFTTRDNQVCCVLTADCVPVLLTDTKSTFVAAIHAGWKGLASNIVAKTIDKIMKDNKKCSDIIAWIGPCISTNCYEVKADLMTKFVAINPNFYENFVISDFKLKLDLVSLTEKMLYNAGAIRIYKSNICTKSNKNLFSARRDGIRSGRIATCVWLDRNYICR